MSEKFGRHYNLKITTQYGIQIQITDPFTIDFSIRKQILPDLSSNTCSLKIHNLSKTTRNLIFKDFHSLNTYLGVEFRAGYSELGLLMKCNASTAYSERAEGSTEVITEIKAFDGGYARNNSFSSYTIAAGALKRDVIIRSLRDLKASPNAKIEIAAVSPEFKGVHTRGVSVGPRSTFDALQTQTGNKFFINDEKSYCMQDDEALTGTIIEISSETGLLGSPRRYEFIVWVEILFEPMLQLNQVVQLKSIVNPGYNGKYVVKAITHTGTIGGAVGGKCKTLVMLQAQPSPKIIVPDPSINSIAFNARLAEGISG